MVVSLYTERPTIQQVAQILFLNSISINITSGIKKVSRPKEKPEEPRKYAILEALFSIQTRPAESIMAK